MKILVRHDRFDQVVVRVGGGIRAREHQLVVEDVEALVLHRAEVKRTDRHDVEHIEVVLAPVGVFVPFHGALQGAHREVDFVLVPMRHVDAELHAPARGRDEVVFHMREVARDEREQIGGLWEGVVPFRHMPPARQCDVGGRIAVRQQYRKPRTVRDHANAIGRHVVRPIVGIGDPAKSFRLALCAEHPIGHVETGQSSVRLRIDLDRRIQPEPRHRWMLNR